MSPVWCDNGCGDGLWKDPSFQNGGFSSNEIVGSINRHDHTVMYLPGTHYVIAVGVGLTSKLPDCAGINGNGCSCSQWGTL
jgi:hypothetical protein